MNRKRSIKRFYSIAAVVAFAGIAVMAAVIITLASSQNRSNHRQIPTDPDSGVNSSETFDTEKSPVSDDTSDISSSESTTDGNNVPTEPLTTPPEPETLPSPIIDIDIPDETYETSPNASDYYDDGYPYSALTSFGGSDYTVLSETENGGTDYINNIIFLGDSLTNGLRAYSMLDGGKNTKQVWVPENKTMLLDNVPEKVIYYPDDNVNITVREALIRKQPKILFVSLGVNGISFYKENAFKEQFRLIVNTVREVSPDTVIVLQSMFPVAKNYSKQYSINNVKISQGNRWMSEVAYELGVNYLDTAEALVAGDGYLPAEYQSGDGMHMNTAGYNIVLYYIKTHMVDY